MERFSSKTLANEHLLSVRSRINKLQESLHYFLAQPNLSWPDALEKFNLLGTQSYNLSQDVNAQLLKSLNVIPIQTLPDPNLSKYNQVTNYSYSSDINHFPLDISSTGCLFKKKTNAGILGDWSGRPVCFPTEKHVWPVASHCCNVRWSGGGTT